MHRSALLCCLTLSKFRIALSDSNDELLYTPPEHRKGQGQDRFENALSSTSVKVFKNTKYVGTSSVVPLCNGRSITG